MRAPLPRQREQFCHFAGLYEPDLIVFRDTVVVARFWGADRLLRSLGYVPVSTLNRLAAYAASPVACGP